MAASIESVSRSPVARILISTLPSATARGPGDHLDRQADQVGGRELGAGALVGIVVKHLEPGILERALELLACRVTGGIPGLHVDQPDVERRHALRPDDAVVVMRGLDDGAEQPRRPDAVGTHRDEMLLAVGALHIGVHRLGILGAEMEDVADLDAAGGNAGVLAEPVPGLARPVFLFHDLVGRSKGVVHFSTMAATAASSS
jgi:hypothetical protein